jgi:hypothetical protein
LLPVLLSLATVLAVTIDQAVTVDQIVALFKAGVSNRVILAMRDRDQPIFTIDRTEAGLLGFST